MWPLIRLLITGHLRFWASIAIPERPEEAKKLPFSQWDVTFTRWQELRKIADDLPEDIREPFERAHCAFVLAMTYRTTLFGPFLRHTICFRISKISRHRYVGFDDALFLAAVITDLEMTLKD